MSALLELNDLKKHFLVRSGPLGLGTTKSVCERDEVAPFLIELHAIPHAEQRTAPQDIELAGISQRGPGCSPVPSESGGVERDNSVDTAAHRFRRRARRSGR